MIEDTFKKQQDYIEKVGKKVDEEVQGLKDKLFGTNQEIVRLNSIISGLEGEIKAYKYVIPRIGKGYD